MIFINGLGSLEDLMRKGLIASSQGLMDGNSLLLIEDFNLDVHEIPKNFLELSRERRFKDFKMKPTIEDPINFYLELAKKFASSAILHYEIFQRGSVFFLQDKKITLFKDCLHSNVGPIYHLNLARKEDFLAYELRKKHFHYLNYFKD